MNYIGLRERFILAIAIAGMPWVAEAQSGSPLPTAKVHVQVFTCFGDKIPEKEITMFRLSSRDAKRDFDRPGRSLVFHDVPYGSYDLLVVDRGGGVARRDVVVNTAEAWVRIGLHFPAGDRSTPPGDLVIEGEVRPPRSGGDWWARAEGLFLAERRESPVSAGGRFSIGGLEMGTYLVEIFEGTKLRHVETVEIDLKQPRTHLVISPPSGSGG
jgi:hypothetical protein